MSEFEPVSTLEDLATLDEEQIIEGYWEGRNGDPEPGDNRGRSVWHGWRNGMIDSGRMEPDAASMALANAVVKSEKWI